MLEYGYQPSCLGHTARCVRVWPCAYLMHACVCVCVGGGGGGGGGGEGGTCGGAMLGHVCVCECVHVCELHVLQPSLKVAATLI